MNFAQKCKHCGKLLKDHERLTYSDLRPCYPIIDLRYKMFVYEPLKVKRK